MRFRSKSVRSLNERRSQIIHKLNKIEEPELQTAKKKLYEVFCDDEIKHFPQCDRR